MANTIRSRFARAAAGLLLPFVVMGCAASTEGEAGSEFDVACDSGKCDTMVRERNKMPAKVIAWAEQNMPGLMHQEFHSERRWDLMGDDARKWCERHNFKRADVQEGAAGSGLEFLAIHRVMLGEFRDAFPDYEELFEGWDSPPVKATRKDPLPADAEAFDPNMMEALDRFENDLASFETDDDFGLFLQTSLRPTEDDPDAKTDDLAAGIHNYLHVRYSNPNSSVNVGDPSVNLGNKVFWRIHGWIDARWTAYRAEHELDDETDKTYQHAMHDAHDWMDTHAHPRGPVGGPKDPDPRPPELINDVFDQ